VIVQQGEVVGKTFTARSETVNRPQRINCLDQLGSLFQSGKNPYFTSTNNRRKHKMIKSPHTRRVTTIEGGKVKESVREDNVVQNGEPHRQSTVAEFIPVNSPEVRILTQDSTDKWDDLLYKLLMFVGASGAMAFNVMNFIQRWAKIDPKTLEAVMEIDYTPTRRFGLKVIQISDMTNVHELDLSVLIHSLIMKEKYGENVKYVHPLELEKKITLKKAAEAVEVLKEPSLQRRNNDVANIETVLLTNTLKGLTKLLSEFDENQTENSVLELYNATMVSGDMLGRRSSELMSVGPGALRDIASEHCVELNHELYKRFLKNQTTQVDFSIFNPQNQVLKEHKDNSMTINQSVDNVSDESPIVETVPVLKSTVTKTVTHEEKKEDTVTQTVVQEEKKEDTAKSPAPEETVENKILPVSKSGAVAKIKNFFKGPWSTTTKVVVGVTATVVAVGVGVVAYRYINRDDRFTSNDSLDVFGTDVVDSVTIGSMSA